MEKTAIEQLKEMNDRFREERLKKESTQNVAKKQVAIKEIRKSRSMASEIDPIYRFMSAVEGCLRQPGLIKIPYGWLQKTIIEYMKESDINIESSQELLEEEPMIWFIRSLLVINNIDQDKIAENLAAITEVIEEIKEKNMTKRRIKKSWKTKK